MQLKIAYMESSRGKYKQIGDPVEVMVFPSNCYKEVVGKCVEALANYIDKEDSGGVFKLMKTGGSRIVEQSLEVDGATVQWTVGNYLKAMGKTPSQVNFGVAVSTEVGIGNL